ncbi:MAG: hypothetical protein SGILL_009396 [Bacillariaceae sp.]
MPSSSPTIRNTLMAEVFGAVIPILTFDVILSDEEAILPMTRNIDSFFTMFLDRILDENSGMYDFDYSHLSSNIIVSSFRQRDGGREETGYSIKMDGTAYYFGPAPLRSSLLHSIKMYFNFWGKQDLEDYLHRLGLKSAVVASVAIDHVPIDIDSGEDPPLGADIGPLETVEKEGTTLSRFVAIAIYVGAVLLIPTSALLLWCYSRRKRRHEEEKASYWKRDNQSASETSESQNTPQRRRGRDEEQSLSGSSDLHRDSVTKSLASASVSITGSNEKVDSDTSALVARGTFK